MTPDKVCVAALWGQMIAFVLFGVAVCLGEFGGRVALVSAILFGVSFVTLYGVMLTSTPDSWFGHRR